MWRPFKTVSGNGEENNGSNDLTTALGNRSLFVHTGQSTRVGVGSWSKQLCSEQRNKQFSRDKRQSRQETEKPGSVGKPGKPCVLCDKITIVCNIIDQKSRFVLQITALERYWPARASPVYRPPAAEFKPRLAINTTPVHPFL